MILPFLTTAQGRRPDTCTELCGGLSHRMQAPKGIEQNGNPAWLLEGHVTKGNPAWFLEGHVTASKLVPLLRYDRCEHVSRPDLLLPRWILVNSNASLYRNLGELSLFVLYVFEHDFESPWLWNVNRGNRCIWLHLLISSCRDRWPCQSLFSRIFGIGGRVLWKQDR